MTYKDHFVTEIKCKGKILRLQDDIAHLPFGSEYSLYLKNLDSRRVSVKISIDGQDILDNSSLVIEPNSSTELEGFLNGIFAKNRFKFIQKTKEIQEYRGDKVDDGIIRVEFSYEKNNPPRIIIHEDIWRGACRGNWWVYDDKYTTNQNTEDISYSYCCNDTPINNMPLQDEGITVKGSECNQNFVYTSMGELEKSQVIIIRLKGISEKTNTVIEKPITVESKLTCSSCGKVSKSSCKYCSNCGTFLS